MTKSNSLLPAAPSPSQQLEKVFVYGTLKSDLWNHVHMLCAESQLIGAAVTEDKWPLIVKNIPFLVWSKGLGTEVFGELYLVPTIGLLGVLDQLEGHPFAYRRVKIPVISSGKKHLAWAYFATPQLLPRKWRKRPFISNFTH